MRFVVISGNISDNEMYVDFVSASSKRAALEKVSDLRGEASDGHLVADENSVFTSVDLVELAHRLDEMSPVGIRNWFDELKKELKR